MTDLFRALSVGTNALEANQSALQTIGHNIANANTEGYHRQRAHLSATPSYDFFLNQIGTGVSVDRVRRALDVTLERSVRESLGQQASYQKRMETLTRIEDVFNEFNTGALTHSLQDFFDALGDLSTHPEDQGARVQLVGMGEILADRIQYIGSRLQMERSQLNDTIESAVMQMDEYTSQVASLNQEIVVLENGGSDNGSANDLRDRRDLFVQRIGEMLDIRVTESSNGSLNVSHNGIFLVSGGSYFPSGTSLTIDDGVAESALSVGGAPLSPSSGSLHGLLEARDNLVPHFENQLRDFSRTLGFEFNKIHSSGFGTQLYSTLTSTESLHDKNLSSSAAGGGVPLAVRGQISTGGFTNQFNDTTFSGATNDRFVGLEVLVLTGSNAGERRTVTDYVDATGQFIFEESFDHNFTAGDTYQISSLPFEVQNGSFDITFLQDSTGVEKTFTIDVDLDGAPSGAASPPFHDDDHLQDIVNDINSQLQTFYGAGSEPIVAEITSDNRFRLRNQISGYSFGFSNDTSHLLAAVGMGTFFTGDNARNFALNDLISQNAGLVATGNTTRAGNNQVALQLAGIRDKTVFDGTPSTLSTYLTSLLSDLGTQTAGARELHENQSVLTDNLDNRRQQISGVNIDEEATELIRFQRAFQGAARFIRVIDELLATLIQST
mgnify:CR=1 FL=1